MLKKHEIKAIWFEADQEGIDQLKNEFFNEAREFVYFRKGQWNGFYASLRNASKLIEEHPELVLTASSSLPLVKEMVDSIVETIGVKREKVIKILKKFHIERHSRQSVVCFRAIVAEGALSKSDIAMWENISELKGSIQTIPEAQKGYFRYIVNEKRYSIFCRIDKDLLQGIIGYDQEIINLLKNKFDLEFYSAATRRALM